LIKKSQPKLVVVREGMVKIKQTKVVHAERDRDCGTRLWFVLLRPTPQTAVAFYINPP